LYDGGCALFDEFPDFVVRHEEDEVRIRQKSVTAEFSRQNSVRQPELVRALDQQRLGRLPECHAPVGVRHQEFQGATEMSGQNQDQCNYLFFRYFVKNVGQNIGVVAQK
jgi:hypothetical protein